MVKRSTMNPSAQPFPWPLFLTVIAAFAFVLVVAGCAGLTAAGTDAPPPTQPVKVTCLPMVNYSPTDQTEFADEAAALDQSKNKQVLRFLGDYRAMREANRACQPG